MKMNTEKQTIVIDANLVFEIDAPHEVVALSKALSWLCDALAQDKKSPLKKVRFNLGEKKDLE